MKEYSIDEIRNVAIAGHGATGKTTLSEAILYTSGTFNRQGRVDDGTTHSDYAEDEIQRQISISASLLHCEWKEVKINIIDTPGYEDFTGEVLSGLRASDATLILIDALSGVEVGTETVWEYTDTYRQARAFFISRLGKEHADFEGVLEQIKKRFGHQAIPVQIPVNPGVGFTGIVDLIQMKAYTYQAGGKGQGKEEEIPAELKAKAEELHEKIIEAAAESNDALLEKFFEGEELTSDEIMKGLRDAMIAKTFLPVFCGDALDNIGTDILINAIVGFFPTPQSISSVKAKRMPKGDEINVEVSPDSPLTGIVFKTIAEPHVGELSFFRVFSGKLSSGDELLNASTGENEKIGQIYLLNGRERSEIGNLGAGDIGTFVKLKKTHTGDTISSKQMPLVLSGINFPEPAIRIAVKPKAKGDEDKISMGLAQLRDEDPSFQFVMDPELKQTILSGQGGLQLEIIVERLKKKFGVEVDTDEPRIPYRETITAKSQDSYRHKKQTGGRGQFGEVWFRMAPLPRASDFEFVNQIKGGAIPSKYIPAVEKGCREAIDQGPMAGYKVVDLQVTVYDGKFHTVDSSELAFKLAAINCFKKCFLAAKPILLEPIYNVAVVVPEEFMGDVMGDLSSRRGKIQGMEQKGLFQIVKAQVPLAELYQYSTHLRSITQGRGKHSRSFSHHEPLPHDIQEEVTKKDQEKEK